jgi:low affinity Fe/Cu permease
MSVLKTIDKALTKMMNNLAVLAGRPFVFAGLFLLALGWFIAGIFLEYDTWYDIMDVFIFLTTFFLLFIVQGSQNADTEAIQDKLDEIIDSLPKANDKKEGEEKRIKRGERK